MSQLLKPCTNCGDLSTTAWCATCRPPKNERFPKASPRKRGYDTTWDKLSVRARRLQPWCSDCGATEDLTTDHSQEAWQRKDDGLPIRLADVDVVCRSCNGKRGQARPATPSSTTDQGGHPDPRHHGPSPQAQVPLSDGPSTGSQGPTAPVKGPTARVQPARVHRTGATS